MFLGIANHADEEFLKGLTARGDTGEGDVFTPADIEGLVHRDVVGHVQGHFVRDPVLDLDARVRELLEGRGRRRLDVDEDVAVGEQLVDGPANLQHALGQNAHPVADELDLEQFVRRDEQGLALVAQVGQDVADLLAGDGIEPGGGFVKDQYVGVAEQGLGHADALPHPLRVAADQAPARVRHPDDLEHFVDTATEVLAPEPVELAVKIEDLLATEKVGIIRALGQVADLAADGGRADVLAAQNLDTAARREDQAEKELDGGGLARPIRPEVAEDLARMNRQVQVLEP